MTYPRSITLIRHGEKPTPHNPDHGVNERGHEHPDSLSPTGWQRAGALAALLGREPVPAPFVRPSRLFSCGYPDNRSGDKHRPHQTLVPLARRLGLDIAVPVLKTEGSALVQGHLLTAAGEDVLVCWQHENIPPIAGALAGALGIGSLPSHAHEWPDDDYHTALIFTPHGAGDGGWQVQQVSQGLLAGDGD